ncbi:hypothetical protein [Siccibacter turicensis]|uniref:Uncharacterized protein n=1 Tax=Siccibacter turicensis TaxID=357233 RepID=A0A2P8VLF3_9ENTR|nr:hypothetical protein [Siccibacter turicensis]MDY0972892.1 hypothetical protein [Siccibacter turicensis]PSN08389.1 hypothetical protein C7G83_09490 [Siccibacter turicensis]
MSSSKEFLLSVYERCNEHLKDQSTKRDQAIAFYLVVLSFYFGSYGNISKILNSPYSPLMFNIVMILVSGMTIRTLAGLRSWHMQYTNSVLFLNNIIMREVFDPADIKAEAQAFYARVDATLQARPLRKLFEGIENRVILGMTLISGLPAAMLVKEVLLMLKFSHKELAFIFEISAYLIYVLYYLRSTIMVIRSSGKYQTWIVNFG